MNKLIEHTLFSFNISRENIVVIISDSAAYMIKCVGDITKCFTHN